MHMKQRTDFPLVSRTLEFLVIFLSFALVSVNSLIRFRQFPEVDNLSDNEGAYIVVAVLVAVTLLFLLWKDNQFSTYVDAWMQNKLLLAFLLYAACSILWSVYIPATFYKLIFLFFSTLVGSCLAVRYQLVGVLNILTWAAGFFAVLSVLLVAFVPIMGIMQNEIFFGSWTGVFWHRNHTGNIFAFFSIVFLLRLLFDRTLRPPQQLIFGLFYLLCVAMVFGSHSATGLIVFLFLHFIVALVFLWLRIQHRLRAVHYYAVGGLLLAGFLIFITNTGFFFGLVGRTSNMTGRIPLWQDLFQRVYLQKPILGYGYGALWMQKSFRIQMQLRHHWDYQVYFADNGFFDILLNTGLVGLALFLANYLRMGYRSFRQAIRAKNGLAFFPLITFLYIFIGNLTYSFMLEVDQLVWMFLVMMVFVTTLDNNRISAQP